MSQSNLSAPVTFPNGWLAFELGVLRRLKFTSVAMVSNEAIAATLDTDSTPEVAARKLLSQANDGGARDNITVVLVRFDPGDSTAGRPGEAQWIRPSAT